MKSVLIEQKKPHQAQHRIELNETKVVDLVQARKIDAILVTGTQQVGAIPSRSARHATLTGRLERFCDGDERHDVRTDLFRMAERWRRYCPRLHSSSATLISELVKSGLAAARAREWKLGHQTGHRPKSDRLVPKVLAAVREAVAATAVSPATSASVNTCPRHSKNIAKILRVSFRHLPNTTPSTARDYDEKRCWIAWKRGQCHRFQTSKHCLRQQPRPRLLTGIE